MNTIQNHPEDELLASYSAASLPLSQALCISVHVEHCDVCNQKLKRLNQLGSQLMHQLKPSAPSANLKKNLLDKLDSITEDSHKDRSSARDNSIPSCLHQFIKSSYQDVAWKRISPDIHSFELCRGQNNAKVELLRIKPGGTSNTHTHLGDEYTVILEGSFSDEAGLYHQGDFIVRNSSHRHTPVATQDKECICLAVTEGPIQLTGLFSRLLNPFIRRSYA
ncbi:MAG: putative transcriptional regulator [Gammaproteobacteria bacterium]|jgi:putative transcriptional regulator